MNFIINPNNCICLEIISESDLTCITLKGIRKQIEAEDSKDYSGEKVIINGIIQECLEKRIENVPSNGSRRKNSKEIKKSIVEDEDFRMALQLQQAEDALSSNKTNLRRRSSGINRKYQEGLIIKSSKKKPDSTSIEIGAEKPAARKLNKPLLLSTEMADLFNNEYSELSRPDVVKKMWEYIKKHNLQDPKDKRFILCDEKLMNLFNRPRINCFKMAKFISGHLHRKEDLSNFNYLKDSSQKVREEPLTSKKQKLSQEIVQDSDEEASEFLAHSDEDDLRMNPLLLSIPGVSAEMSFTSVQAAVLAYTQAMKLRHPSDMDLIIVKPTSPIARLMDGKQSDGVVHILDLIHRVHYLFDHKNAE